MPALPTPALAEVEQWMQRLYVDAEDAALRREDRRKAVEVTAMLAEIARALRGARDGAVLVDAASGKGYIGLLAALLLFVPAGVRVRVLALEREPRRAALASALGDRFAPAGAFECRVCDVADPSAWPERPELVAALHACGAAADAVSNRAVAAGARRLLLVPCCTGEGVPGAAAALARAERDGIPRAAPVRRRYLQAMIDAERTLRLEAAGYHTEVVELIAPTVTPHNLLWRALKVGEPIRMAEAESALRRLYP
jgi:hypothetical protein